MMATDTATEPRIRYMMASWATTAVVGSAPANNSPVMAPGRAISPTTLVRSTWGRIASDVVAGETGDPSSVESEGQEPLELADPQVSPVSYPSDRQDGSGKGVADGDPRRHHNGDRVGGQQVEAENDEQGHGRRSTDRRNRRRDHISAAFRPPPRCPTCDGDHDDNPRPCKRCGVADEPENDARDEELHGGS